MFILYRYNNEYKCDIFHYYGHLDNFPDENWDFTLRLENGDFREIPRKDIIAIDTKENLIKNFPEFFI